MRPPSLVSSIINSMTGQIYLMCRRLWYLLVHSFTSLFWLCCSFVVLVIKWHLFNCSSLNSLTVIIHRSITGVLTGAIRTAGNLSNRDSERTERSNLQPGYITYFDQIWRRMRGYFCCRRQNIKLSNQHLPGGMQAWTRCVTCWQIPQNVYGDPLACP